MNCDLFEVTEMNEILMFFIFTFKTKKQNCKIQESSCSLLTLKIVSKNIMQTTFKKLYILTIKGFSFVFTSPCFKAVTAFSLHSVGFIQSQSSFLPDQRHVAASLTTRQSVLSPLPQNPHAIYKTLPLRLETLVATPLTVDLGHFEEPH